MTHGQKPEVGERLFINAAQFIAGEKLQSMFKIQE